MYCPALHYQSENYPADWHGRVPKRVRICKAERSDIPIPPVLEAKLGTQYEVYVNSHGAVAAILPEMQLLGLLPDEFEIVEWHTGTEFACSFQVDSESVKPTQEVLRATAR